MSDKPHYLTPTPLLPRLIRIVYRLLFVAVCVAGGYYVGVYAPAIGEHSPTTPVGQHVIPHHEDGEIVYVTAQQQMELNLYGAALATSLLAWLGLGLVLEMVFKIRIFKPLPKPAVSKSGVRHGPPTTFSPN